MILVRNSFFDDGLGREDYEWLDFPDGTTVEHIADEILRYRYDDSLPPIVYYASIAVWSDQLRAELYKRRMARVSRELAQKEQQLAYESQQQAASRYNLYLELKREFEGPGTENRKPIPKEVVP